MSRPHHRAPAAALRLAAVAAVALSAACSSATVHTDFDRNATFTHYRTYSYKPGHPANNQLIDRRIVAEIEGQLAKRGLTRVDSNADLIATYHVALENELDVQTFGYAAYGPYWSAGPTSTQVRNVPVGTLIVDLLDSAGTHLVWRGQGRQEVSKNPDTVSRDVKDLVDRMFQDYPPKKA